MTNNSACTHAALALIGARVCDASHAGFVKEGAESESVKRRKEHRQR